MSTASEIRDAYADLELDENSTVQDITVEVLHAIRSLRGSVTLLADRIASVRKESLDAASARKHMHAELLAIRSELVDIKDGLTDFRIEVHGMGADIKALMTIVGKLTETVTPKPEEAVG